MANQDDEENLSTVGSGRVDALFDDLEASIAELEEYPDDLASIRRRIEKNDGETSGHVRSRILDDADQLGDDLEETTDRLLTELRELKRAV